MNRPPLSVRAAERVSQVVGSWTFIIVQSLILGAWVVLNVLAWRYRWDAYPFVFLNLMLSFQAAYTAPVLLMASSHHEAQDRRLANTDHEAIVKLHAHMCAIDDQLETIEGLLRK